MLEHGHVLDPAAGITGPAPLIGEQQDAGSRQDQTDTESQTLAKKHHVREPFVSQEQQRQESALPPSTVLAAERKHSGYS